MHQTSSHFTHSIISTTNCKRQCTVLQPPCQNDIPLLNTIAMQRSRFCCYQKTSWWRFCRGFHDRYKTVAIYCDPKAKKTVARVYTLGGEKCWRKIKSFPYLPRWSSASYTERCGKFVSGTLNWLATNPNDRGSLIVASIDIGNETCVEILLPSVVEKLQHNARPKLWVLGGCLCFSYNFNDIYFVLWQMKVHGVTDSWTKLITISYMDFGMDHCFHNYPRPFFMLEKGEILLQINHHGAFIIYNPRLKSFQSLWLESDQIIFEGTTHIESLVSSCSC
ncbi:hypothetical protein Lal_00017423 [Lupinus albus]|nr:hypothetical protein Lal_00017423 [Lupinus albus]